MTIIFKSSYFYLGPVLSVVYVVYNIFAQDRELPKLEGYTDWREMFQNHTKELDVVFVATPDHTHYGPSMTAISNGIHCYTEKPLAWSVREAQNLTKAYEKNKSVVTQMGNQGHNHKLHYLPQTKILQIQLEALQ